MTGKQKVCAGKGGDTSWIAAHTNVPMRDRKTVPVIWLSRETADVLADGEAMSATATGGAFGILNEFIFSGRKVNSRRKEKECAVVSKKDISN